MNKVIMYLPEEVLRADDFIAQSAQLNAFASFYDIWQEELDIEKEYQLWQQEASKFASKYGPDLQPYSQANHEKNLHLPHIMLPQGKNAILIHNSDLRAIPSLAPYFNNPQLAGEGYPFDYAQESHLHIFTPVKLLWLSDEWSFVVTNEQTKGWVKTDHLKEVSDEMQNSILAASKMVFTRENIASYISGQEGDIFYDHIKIGAILPVASTLPEEPEITLAFNFYQDKDSLRFSSLNDLPSAPLDFNFSNITQVVNEFIDMIYGWGGLLGNRDCSSFIRDFYRCFGYDLPRNSRAQKESIAEIEIKDLTLQEKEAAILEYALPYKALLHAPGHIAIYAGQNEQGDILIHHSIWGAKTIDRDGAEGRHLIGKNAITKLDFSQDLDDASPSNFISKLDSILLLNEWEN